jgi:hypothetical protein
MARTEEQMQSEMTGMAAPSPDMPMEGDMDEPSSLTVDSMVSNFNAMEPQLQEAIKPLFSGDGVIAMNQLLGESLVSGFTSQIDMASPQEPAAPAPAPAPATPATPQEGMMAPEPTAMAQGGMLNTQMKDMVRQGMSPQQIRNKLR